MVNFTQIILTIVVTTLTILLVVIGLQVVKILQEIRKMLQKVNKIMDDAGLITESVAKPISNLSEVIQGFKGSFQLVETVMNFFVKKKEKKEKEGGESE